MSIHQRSSLIALTATLILRLASTNAFAKGIDEAEAFRVMAANPSIEQHERHIDGAALDSQKKAISSIRALLRKYQGKRQEPLLLLRLVESEQEAAGIQYRIAHGPQVQNTGKAGHEFHKKLMKDLVSDLSTLVSKFSHLEEIPHIFYMRGNAYDELEMTSSATKDFLELIEHYPNAEDYMRACMALAEIHIKAKDYHKTIQYLKLVEKDPTDSHYPFALYKMGWAYYNLNDMAQGLSYMTKVVRYYDSKAKNAGLAKDNTNEALRENALLDIALFYFEAFERKVDSYDSGRALSYFKDLDEGQGFGKMLIRFAKLLRSHGHIADLHTWKNQVLELKRAESFDVLLVVYENQSNRHDYKGILDSAQDMVAFNRKILDEAILEKGRKFLIDTAEELQGIVLKNRDAEDLNLYSGYLAGVYDAFIKVVDDVDEPGKHDKDPRVVKAHYNLAETLFQIKKFEASTEHYRWIVDHLGNSKSNAATTKDASLKSIASRYELLKQRKLIPDTLAARGLPASRDDADDKLDAQLEQWIGWIDDHVAKYDDVTDNFYFEANRCLYREGRMMKATTRMRKFAQKNPNSKFAIPSAALVIDTYLASSDWEELHDIASGYLKIKEWKSNPFYARLKKVDQGALYKIAQADFESNQFKRAFRIAASAIQDSDGGDEFYLLAAKAALGLGEDGKAEDYFTKLIVRSPHSADGIAALLNRAALHEKLYSFAKAAADYRKYLESSLAKMAEKEAQATQRRGLTLAWISGDQSELKNYLVSKNLCANSLREECDKFEALLAIKSLAQNPKASSNDDAESAFQKARKSGLKETTKTLWAAVALMSASHLGFRDRNAALRTFTTGFEDLDPLVRTSLLSEMANFVPNVFSLNRKSLESSAPLGASEKHIIHRIDMIKEYENAAASAAKIPFVRIKALVLNELAWVYSDFAKGLKTIPAPKGVTGAALEDYQNLVQKILLPFEDKGADIRKKAFELATKSSIEKDSLVAITEPFNEENPSQAKAISRAPASIVSNESKRSRDYKLSNEFFLSDKPTLEDLDEDGHWKILRASFTEPNNRLRFQFKTALNAQNWPLCTYLLQKTQEEDLLPALSQHFMKAIFMKKLGAQAEGLLELSDARDLMGGNSK